MTDFGVRRLVAINSGGYRFADIALAGPIHLVAPNNRGKSTLVNALQFLYVDELRAMRFPRSVDETREHYFGKSPSYLLFECHTAAGPQSLLVVGRGRVAGSAFARFVFAGGYRADDFKDPQGRLVEFDVLKARLANRSLQEVKPSELWETLCNPTRRGRPEENGHRVPHMGLLPIRTREDYRSFREAYVRLLSLSDMSAVELRQLLIACHAAEVGDIKLDVAADYRDEFERAERTESRLAFLDAAGHLIDDGERGRGRVETSHTRFQSSAPAVFADFCGLSAALRNGESIAAREEKTLDSRQVDLNEARSEASRREGRLLGDVERMEAERTGLDALHAKWSACTPEMVQTMRDNADAGRDRIAAQRERIRQAGTFDLNAMKRSVQSLRHDAESHERSLANWEKQLSGWLASHGVKPDTIVQAFSVLNPALLRLIVGTDVFVTDPAALVDRINVLAERIEDGQYQDEVARVAVSSVIHDVLPVADARGEDQRGAAVLGVLRDLGARALNQALFVHQVLHLAGDELAGADVQVIGARLLAARLGLELRQEGVPRGEVVQVLAEERAGGLVGRCGGSGNSDERFPRLRHGSNGPLLGIGAEGPQAACGAPVQS